MGVMDEIQGIMETDDGSAGEPKNEKKYFIDTVHLKVPRADMEVHSFLEDCMSS